MKKINIKNYITWMIIIILWVLWTLIWQANEIILIIIAWISWVLWIIISSIFFYESLKIDKMYLRILFSIVNILIWFGLSTLIIFIFNILF